MSTSKVILNFLFTFLILSTSKLIAAEIEEHQCDKLIIEGGAKAVRKIFTDFNEIKETINELKSNIQECPKGTNSSSKYQPLFDARYDVLPQKCLTKILPKNCAEATACTRRSGIYKIQVDNDDYEPRHVECDAETEGGGWIVIQRRQDGSVDFYRTWKEYEEGFGNPQGEHCIGLKMLHGLTNFDGPQELLIIMEDVNNTRAYAKYNTFEVGGETEMYKLKSLGKYSGTAGDSLSKHLGMKFTTKDRDNDIEPNMNCAINFTGAWWYEACHYSNLNGKYGDNTHAKGVVWYAYRGYSSSLPYVKMMIRRRGIN